MQYFANGSLKDVLYLNPNCSSSLLEPKLKALEGTSGAGVDPSKKEEMIPMRKPMRPMRPSRTRRGVFGWADIVNFAHQAAAGVVHLHSEVRISCFVGDVEAQQVNTRMWAHPYYS